MVVSQSPEGSTSDFHEIFVPHLAGDLAFVSQSPEGSTSDFHSCPPKSLKTKDLSTPIR